MAATDTGAGGAAPNHLLGLTRRRTVDLMRVPHGICHARPRPRRLEAPVRHHVSQIRPQRSPLGIAKRIQ